DSVLRAADSVRLSLADARTLLGIVADPEFAAKLPHDTMTIAEILVWGRTEHARMERAAAETTAAARAREEERKRQLDSLLTVTLVSKGYLPKDPDLERFDDYISLTFAYRNKGTKPVRAFQGDVAFLDAVGDTIYSAHLKVELALGPGQTRREQGRIIKYNPFRTEHQRLRDPPRRPAGRGCLADGTAGHRLPPGSAARRSARHAADRGPVRVRRGGAVRGGADVRRSRCGRRADPIGAPRRRPELGLRRSDL